MGINKRISSLERRAELWTPSSDWGIQITEESTAEGLAQRLISEKAIPETRFGYAIRELFIALGKLFRLYDTARQISGEQSLKTFIIPKTRCREMLLPLYPSEVEFDFSDALAFLSRVTKEIDQGDFELDKLRNIESRRDFLGIVARYLDEKAIEEFFTTYGHTYDSEFVIEIENSGHLTTYLEGSDDDQLNWMMKNFRASEWLLPWITYHVSDMNLGQSYLELFRYQNANMETTMLISKDISSQIMEENPTLDINTNNLRAVLDRISEAIQHFGYRNFVERATDTGQYGSDSILGAGAINVIPSSDNCVSACCEMVVTIAEGPGLKYRSSFGSVLRELRSHLLECRQSTKLVIILSNTEDSRAIKENNLDLQFYRDKGIIFVPLYVIDDQITKMPIGWLGLR